MLSHTKLRTAAAAAIATCALAPAAQARFDLNPPDTGSAASHYTPQALRAMGLRYTALANSYTAAPPDSGSAASHYTPQALRAMGLRDTALANSYTVAHTQASASPGFNWADAGIGAAGIIVILGAAGASTTLIRHRRQPPRLAS